MAYNKLIFVESYFNSNGHNFNRDPMFTIIKRNRKKVLYGLTEKKRKEIYEY